MRVEKSSVYVVECSFCHTRVESGIKGHVEQIAKDRGFSEISVRLPVGTDDEGFSSWADLNICALCQNDPMSAAKNKHQFFTEFEAHLGGTLNP